MSTTFGRFFQKIVNFFNTLESLYTMTAAHDVNRVWIEEPNCSEARIPAVSEKTGVPACATFDWLIPVMFYTEYFTTARVERFLCFIIHEATCTVSLFMKQVFYLAPVEGLEPPTHGLTIRRSTN